ncbi:unnamed protein product [Owenia fusiformis]|uniref:Uncharacterized protein n=1 Tax=Owenia fusiformis TaxID=6347 RepID=A0A8J1XIX4_OWEFU|nr:unnamed protein product [Owenia fusiformis]
MNTMANEQKTQLVLTPRDMFSNNTHLGLLNKGVDYTNPREWYDTKRKASFIDEFVHEYNRSVTDFSATAKNGNLAVYFALPPIQKSMHVQGRINNTSKQQLSNKQQKDLFPKVSSLDPKQLINGKFGDKNRGNQCLANKESEVAVDVKHESMVDKVLQESTYTETFITTLPRINEVDNSETDNIPIVSRIELPQISLAERNRQIKILNHGNEQNSVISVNTDNRTGNHSLDNLENSLDNIPEETQTKSRKHVIIGEVQENLNQTQYDESALKMESLKILKYRDSSTLPHAKAQTKIPLDRYMILREDSNVSGPIDRSQYRLKQKSMLKVKLDHKKLDKQRSKSTGDLHKAPERLNLTNIKSKIGHLYNSYTSLFRHATPGDPALRKYKSDMLPAIEGNLLAVDTVPCVPMFRLDHAPDSREGEEISGVGAVALANTTNEQTKHEPVQRYNTRQGPVTYKPKESPKASVVNITIGARPSGTPLRNMSRLAGWSPRNEPINEEVEGSETVKPPHINIDDVSASKEASEPVETNTSRSSSRASTNSKGSTKSNDDRSEKMSPRLDSPTKKSVHFYDNDDETKSYAGTISTMSPTGRKSQQKPKLVLKKFNKLEVFGEHTNPKTIHYRYKSASTIGPAEEPIEYLPKLRPPQYKLDLKDYPPTKPRREMSANSDYTYTTDDSCDKTTVDAESYLDSHSQRGEIDSRSPTRKFSPQKPKSGLSSYKGPDPSMATYRDTTVNVPQSVKSGLTSGVTSTTVDVTESTFELSTSESSSDKISSIDKTGELSSITKDTNATDSPRELNENKESEVAKISSVNNDNTKKLTLANATISNSDLKPAVSTSDISSFTLSDTTVTSTSD